MNRKLVNIISFALLGPVAFGQSPKGGYTIKGDIKGLKDPYIYRVFSGDTDGKDSAAVSNGHFTFTGKVAEPTMTVLYAGRMQVRFFIENKTIYIDGSADSSENIRVKGSSTQKEYEAYNSSMKDIRDRQEKLYQQYEESSTKKDTATLSSVKAQLKTLGEERKDRTKKYIASHLSSPISLYELRGLAFSGDPAELEKIFSSLDSRQQNSAAGQNFSKELAIMKKIAIGQPALDFSQKNMQGQSVQFSQYSKGKYVLLDFWASWCGPCRAENPNVLKAYNQFKDKQFEVLGVSLDDDGAKWKEAVQKDGMPWVQVSDLKGWKNEAARQYNINGIPSNFLVDPNGIIIARDLRGEDLEKKLAEVLK
jgi:peroxiredoxin